VIAERGGLWQNWGRSETSHPLVVVRAESVDDVIATVRMARDRGLTIRPIGAGHSFTGIAATDGIQLDVSAIDGVLAVDGNLVTLGAGTNLYQLPALLKPYGLALTNMGDIDRQTIAGATSTGTHGTGATYGGLATQIRAVTLVTGTGDILHVSDTENAELLPAVALGLGALGVLVDITVECVPAFVMRAVERAESFELVASEWQQRIDESDHFEFYLFPHADLVSTKTNTRMAIDTPRTISGPVKTWFDDVVVYNWALAAICNIGRIAPVLTPPLNRLAVNVSGKRTFTDFSHEVFVSSRTTRFKEMEYNIPQEAIPAALRDVRAALETFDLTISFPIEVRAAASDDLWLSTASGRASGYIAFHKYYRDDHRDYFRIMESIMVEYGGRPHWGKMHTRDAEYLAGVYPRFADFLALRDRLDPDRVFANRYLEQVLGA
jgi:L-gulono-1,4-lactone dehydrogenase